MTEQTTFEDRVKFNVRIWKRLVRNDPKQLAAYRANPRFAPEIDTDEVSEGDHMFQLEAKAARLIAGTEV